MTELLKLRKMLKAKKPHFVRQKASLKRLRAWRVPRGMHSPMRKKRKGYKKQPSIGYSSPRGVRGLTPEGFKFVLVSSPSELHGVSDAFILASGVGMRKRLEILNVALAKQLKVLNVRDPHAYMKLLEGQLLKRREAKKAKESKKKVSREEALKKSRAKKEESEAQEEKEKKMKEEKRKVLESK